MIYKSYKIRLEPNNKKLSALRGHAGVNRHAYNQGLNYCNELRKKGEKTPSAIDLHKWLVANIKKEFSWYYDYSKCSPQQALRDLETAYKNFHRLQKKSGYSLKDKKGRLQGLPNFKKKGIKDSFYLEGAIKIENKKIKLPKIGWINLSEFVEVSQVKNCVISRVSNDWFIAFKTEYNPIKTEKKYKSVGVDLGIKTLAVLSNGEEFINVKPYGKAKSKLRKQQKEVSRRFIKGAKNQSSNYKKSILKLSKTHKKVADVRKDNIHKLTTYLAKNFEVVSIEDLKPKNMSKNHNLASAILDGGFFEFKRQLLYKKEWYGGSVFVANTFFPSSKTCNVCGNINKELKLSQRTWTCKNGHKLNRDLNASINLEKLAMSSIVSAFGDKSSVGVNPIQLVDELGKKHQMFTFV
jgi:putative transposase